MVETDVQRTILNSYEVGFQDRHKPVSNNKASAEYIIYDGAPYTKDRTSSWLKKMDIILIPLVVSPNDITSLAQTINELPKAVQELSFVVFNRVIKPYRKSHKAVIPLIEKILKGTKVKKINTELSQLDAFALIGGSKNSTLLEKKSSGKKALEQVKSLVNEVNI